VKVVGYMAAEVHNTVGLLLPVCSL